MQAQVFRRPSCACSFPRLFTFRSVPAFFRVCSKVCIRIRAENRLRYWREHGLRFVEARSSSPSLCAEEAGEEGHGAGRRSALQPHQLRLASAREHFPAPHFVEPIAPSHIPAPFPSQAIDIPPPPLDLLELEVSDGLGKVVHLLVSPCSFL